MSEQSSNHKAVEQLAAGDHVITKATVHEVQHTFRFRNGDGRNAVAVTLRPLGNGEPFVMREPEGTELRLATEQEIATYRAFDARAALTEGLDALGRTIWDRCLPVSFANLTVVLDSPADVAEWAKAGRVVVETRNGYATADFRLADLYVHVQATVPPSADEQAGA